MRDIVKDLVRLASEITGHREAGRWGLTCVIDGGGRLLTVKLQVGMSFPSHGISELQRAMSNFKQSSEKALKRILDGFSYVDSGEQPRMDTFGDDRNNVKVTRTVTVKINGDEDAHKIIDAAVRNNSDVDRVINYYDM